MPAFPFEALELAEWVQAAGAGWRYLCSRSFRNRTHSRWQQQSRRRVAWDVVCGLAGIALTCFLLYVIISLFAIWDWIERLVALTRPECVITVEL